MALVKIHKQVPENANSGEWTLCFHKVTYHYEDGSMQDGFRFIWRRPDGSLQAARGQACIETYEQMMALINQAKEEGFFEEIKRQQG